MRLFLLLLSFVSVVLGHEGHIALLVDEEIGRSASWLQWIGSFHFIFLHFPIALIVLTAVAELFYSFSKRAIYDYSARFMLIAAAILTLPTAILGLIYSLTGTYTGQMETLLTWHKWFGITAALLAIVTAYVREREGRTKLYLVLIALLFLLVCATAYFGGAMTFGPNQLIPS